MWQNLIYPIIFSFIFFLASYGYGILFFYIFRKEFPYFLIFTIGLGIISYIIFFAGILKLYYPFIFHTILLIGLLSLFLQVKLFNRRIKTDNFSIGEFILFILIFFIILYLLGTCLTPAYMYDSLNYHFSVPEMYLLNNGIYPMFYNLHSNMPFLGDIIWVFFFNYTNEYACKIFILIQIIFLLIIHYHLARRLLSPLLSLISILFFLYAYLNLWTSYHVYIGNDVLRTLYLYAAIYSYILYIETKEKISFILSAIFLGLGLSTKYFVILFGIPTMKIIIAFTKKSLLEKTKTIIIYMTIALATFSPWLIKQYLYTGDPIYPILYNLFPTKKLYIYPAQRRTLYSEKSYTGTAIDKALLEKNKKDNMYIVSLKILLENAKRIFFPYRDFLLIPGLFISIFFLFSKNFYLRIFSLISLLFYIESLFLGEVHWYRYFCINYSITAIIFTYFLMIYFRKYFSKIFIIAVILLFFQTYSFFSTRYKSIKEGTCPFMVIGKNNIEKFYKKQKLWQYYKAREIVKKYVPIDKKMFMFDNYLTFGFRRKGILPDMDSLYAVYNYFFENKNKFETLKIFWKENIEYVVLFPIDTSLHRILKNEIYNFCLLYGKKIYKDKNLIIFKLKTKSEYYREERLRKTNTFSSIYEFFR